MSVLLSILKLVPARTAYAHCDIPCGIYDVQALQMAAHTVIRMTGMLSELKREDETKAEHDVARIVHVKEEHGGIVEKELGTLENDYFKPEHHEKYPELKDLISSAVKLSVKVRQNIDKESADKLLDASQRIAEIFYKTKNFEPLRAPSGYPTGGEIVMHK